MPVEEVGRGTDMFERNEEDANRYAAFCMRVAAAVAVLMWCLNILGFLIVEPWLMNAAMPVGILLFLLPSLLIRRVQRRRRALKYVIMVCFLLGIGVMAAVLTIQLILAWACPLILSCHYYAPRFTHFTLVGVLACMLCSLYVGLYCGVWDGNMMRGSAGLAGVALRAAFIRGAAAVGDNILLRVFNFYYIPRAAVLVVVYLIGGALSRRTHGLLRRQAQESREKERIGTELRVAAQIRTSVLPCLFPAFPEREEFDICASMTPAKEVGGDFYDFFLVDDDHLALVIADVSGKGIPAALFMVTAKTMLKNAAQADLSPGAVLEQVNGRLCENNEAEMFATVWLGIYEISTGKLTAANAGHEYPALRRSGGAFELIRDRRGFVLAGMEGSRYQEYELQLQPGDVLFVYTNGVTGAANGVNVLYGTGRMLRALNRAPDAGPKELLRWVKTDVEWFAGSAAQFDDITMLAIQRKAAGKEPSAEGWEAVL